MKITRKSAGCFPTYEEYSKHVDAYNRQERGRVKVIEIIGVDKKGRPIENDEVIEFDEQVALAEYDDIFDPMNEQHYSRERWDR